MEQVVNGSEPESAPDLYQLVAQLDRRVNDMAVFVEQMAQVQLSLAQTLSALCMPPKAPTEPVSQ